MLKESFDNRRHGGPSLTVDELVKGFFQQTYHVPDFAFKGGISPRERTSIDVGDEIGELPLRGRRVLYISYNGMLDPLGQSQVIPYLRVLNRREGVKFVLLSFERPETLKGSDEAVKSLKSSLAAHGIEWHFLIYHKRPSLPATAFDILNGIRKARALSRSLRIDLIHARGHIPAAIAIGVKQALNCKFLFDVRGLMADEYADAGHWQVESLPWKLTKALERRAFLAADGVVTLTDRIWPIIRDWEGLKGRSVEHEVIPCCADLEKFRFDEQARREKRDELNLDDQFVVVYSGSIGGWYLNEEMADFFSVLLRQKPNAHALWLTPSRHGEVRALMKKRGLSEERFTVRGALPKDVASYLSASDAGIAFIKPCFSKLASSPTKNAEYLACGLPIVINSGVGDTDSLVVEEAVGALVTEFSSSAYSAAIQTLEVKLQDIESARQHCRETAERLFNVKTIGLARYASIYRRLLCRN